MTPRTLRLILMVGVCVVMMLLTRSEPIHRAESWTVSQLHRLSDADLTDLPRGIATDNRLPWTSHDTERTSDFLDSKGHAPRTSPGSFVKMVEDMRAAEFEFAAAREKAEGVKDLKR